MTAHQPTPIYLKDYTPPEFLIDTVSLRFELGEEETNVTSVLTVARNPAGAESERPLTLDGRALTLDTVALDGETLSSDRYSVDSEHLIIPDVPDRFALEVNTTLKPQDNTSLEGLYRSSGNFCTQCEAEGFRKITYFLDRPDIMARYTTTIVADRSRYPVLLSNGNPVSHGELENGRHWVTWEDPFRKPSYLFALVAGDLATMEDRYVTRSGRDVALRIYVQKHNADKCAHAMSSLKRAMQWDEEVFGLEYDLDIFMIVAVDDFNMGAMENKGLNIFNSKYILAKPETATDNDFAAIEEVIGHEYFHNWTGNRVTCRDWFQLSLKEGLTVFRDQEFSSDMTSRPVKRIQDVRILRNSQFTEDAGPMAHPVRPDSYIEISNFYTPTVYNKGAEVIRMIQTLIGRDGFRSGLRLYLERHDGSAATTDDFVQAMQDATGTDLTQFRRWYSQAGTPELTIEREHDSQKGIYTLTVSQSCPPTPGQAEKLPFHIPLAMGLLDSRGRDLPLKPDSENDSPERSTQVLELRKEKEIFRFTDIPYEPVPSLLRSFSAPVKLSLERSDEELAHLFAHDSDAFSRWDAGQTLFLNTILALVAEHQQGRPLLLQTSLVEAMQKTLADHTLDRAFAAEAMTLPTESYIGTQMDIIDVDAIHLVRRHVRKMLAVEMKDELEAAYDRNDSTEPYVYHPAKAGWRALKNLCLAYLMELDEDHPRSLCIGQFKRADNMTDRLAALGTLANTDCAERKEALAEFHDRWRNDPLVLDKWFTIQATSRLPDTLAEVGRLMNHPAFELRNPNKVRALIGAFCHGNQVRFHASGGEGYRFLADQVLELDPLNPQIAARLLGALSRWRKFDESRQALMKQELERILGTPNLSKDTYEVASKTLA